MKIITSKKNNLLSVHQSKTLKINKHIGIITSSDIKIKQEDLLIDNQTYYRSIGGEVFKFDNLGQLNDVPNLISRLFCYIDNKNNIWISSDITRKSFLGNLINRNDNVYVSKKVILNDFISSDESNPSDTLHPTSYFDIIENSELETLEYILKNNKDTRDNISWFGYIDVPDDYIFSEKDVDNFQYGEYKIGQVITDKLYDYPISINIIANIKDGQIYRTSKLVKDIIFINLESFPK